METVNRIFMFVVLLLVQVLILNHIHLFQIATPLLYVYFVLTFSMDTPKWVVLTSSFGLGLLIDIFANTAGMAAGCMTLIAMLTAGAMVLMYFEFPVPGIPPFYKMDFSEIPIIIGAFAMGPVAGVIMEFLKILLNLLFTGTSTVFVGEFANFIMGCCFVVPASILYYAKKTKVMSRIGLGIGCFMVTVCSCLLNAFVLLPTYSKLFHMDMSALVAMGTEKNSMISSLGTFIIFGVAPFNLIKYGLVSLVTILVYKRISRLLKKQQ